MDLPFFASKNDVIYNEFRQHKKCQNLSLNSIIRLGNIAWYTGILTSLNVPKTPIFELICDNNITINTRSFAPTSNSIIFSSFNRLDNSITLYKDTIENYFIPSIPPQFNVYSNYENATYLLVLHEYFHFLQCNNFYSLNIYPLNPLNEIAAYSFAQNRRQICFE